MDNKSMIGLKTNTKISIKSVFMYAAVFPVTLAVCLGLLVLVACIPKTALSDNMRKSSAYFLENENYYELYKGISASTVDNYSDPILLNIAWNINSAKPLESVLWAKYLHVPEGGGDNHPNMYLDRTINGEAPNTEYMRYWHGSLVFVMPLLTIMDIKGIYLVMTILVIGFFAADIFILARKKYYRELFAFAAGYIATMGWLATTCLEYTWTYLLTFIFVFLLVKADGKRKRTINIIFLLSGMLTVYFDFLTAEVMTLTVPLLIAVSMECSGKQYTNTKDMLKRNGVRTLLWTIGYGGMWACKWIISGIVLKISLSDYVKDHIVQRTLIVDEGSSPLMFIAASIKKNFKMLFPWNMGGIGIAAIIVLLAAMIYLGCIFPRKKYEWTIIIGVLLIALIPLLRVSIMTNHSLGHYFYTYRVFYASVGAIIIALLEIVDFDAIADMKTRPRKKSRRGKK